MSDLVAGVLAANAAELITTLEAENASLRAALTAISRLRPAGDVARCIGARELVEGMELIALRALRGAPHA